MSNSPTLLAGPRLLVAHSCRSSLPLVDLWATLSRGAGGQSGIDVVDDDEPSHRVLGDVAGSDQPAQPGQKTVVVPEGVEHHDRFRVHTQIARCPGFEEFLERSDAAGQRHERVGAVLHDLLALPHGVGDDELVGLGVGDLPVHQRLRDDPDGVAAVCPGRGRPPHPSPTRCRRRIPASSPGRRCRRRLGGPVRAGRDVRGPRRSRRRQPTHDLDLGTHHQPIHIDSAVCLRLRLLDG